MSTETISSTVDAKTTTSGDRRRWLVLALIVTAQFMVVLDIAIVNVALPSIKTDLHFSQVSLQWVITAYSILFGGVLMLGGAVFAEFFVLTLYMQEVLHYSALHTGLAYIALTVTISASTIQRRRSCAPAAACGKLSGVIT